jgi:protease I
VIGRGGTVIRPDRAIRDLAADRLDAVVIVGGMGAARHLWNNAELRALVVEADRRKKVVAAICLAPGALARAGVLAGRKATCYPDPVVVAELEGGGADYVDAAVVATGNIVTGGGPESAREFGAKILEALGRRPAGPAAGPAP